MAQDPTPLCSPSVRMCGSIREYGFKIPVLARKTAWFAQPPKTHDAREESSISGRPKLDPLNPINATALDQLQNGGSQLRYAFQRRKVIKAT